MSDDRKVRLGITADSGEAEDAFQRVGESAEKAADKVKRAGDKAGKAFEDFVGPPTREAAKRAERDTNSIVASIERATAAMNAGSKGSADYFEQLAKQRGVSTEALKPYLDQLRQAEAAQQAATKGLGSMEISAKQTAAALRGVPAQFTDIITSLQGGQAPLTVFLQQGGQLKDMFGGAGNAARALGGYVLGLINPFTLAAGAAAALAAGYFAGAEEAQRFNRTLVLTGNQAGVTVGQLTAMAQTLDAIGGTTQGKATDALNALAETGKVGAENLQRFALAAINLEKVGGPAIDQTAKAFADLARDPLQGSLKLNESTNFLTKSIYEQIKALTDQGRTVEAARVAQEAYSSAIEGRTPKIIEQLGYIERAWRGVGDVAKEAIDAIKGVGRIDNTLQAAISRTQRQLDNANAVGDASAANEAQRLLERLQQSLELEKQVLKLRGDQTKEAQAKADFDKAGEQYLSKQVLLEREIAKARELGRAARESEAVIEKRVADIRAKAAAADNKTANRDREQQLKREADLLAQINGFNSDFEEKWRELNKLRAAGKITVEQLEQAQAKLLAQQPVIAKQNKELADSYVAIGRAEVDAIEQRQKYLDTLNKGAQEAANQVQRLQDEEKAAAIAAAGNLSLAQAIQQVAIARLQEAKSKTNDAEAIAAIDREIAARRELITLIGSGEARKVSTDAAREAEREWTRTAQRIEDSLTDALLRGFESGKGFAQNLKDTVENMFRTMVLRPVIQMAFGGGMGMGGSSAMAGGNPFAGGGGSSMQSVQQFWNLLTGGVGDRIGASVTSGLDSLGMDYFGSGVAGSAAGALANGFAGYGISKALSGGYSAGSWVNTAAGIASAIPGIGPIAGVIGAAVNRAFGRKAKETTEAGLTGSIGGGDFTGQTYADWLQKGGWFRSDKRGTEMGAVDSDLEKALDMGAATLLQSTKAWAAALLLPAEQLDAVTSTFKVKLTDNEQENQKAIADLLTGYGTALTAGFSAQLTPFIRDGETASQTLERLAGSLQGVNGVLDALGQAALQASAQGGAYASALLDQFGSLQQFQSAAGQYLQDYYSQAERSALATQGLAQQLGSLGLSVPASRDAYRQLVEAQDLSTEAGRKAYAALLQLAPTFAELVPAIEAVADVVDETAQRMAEAGRRALEDLARDSGSLQVDLLRAQGDESAARALERDQALAAVRGKVTEADLAAITAAYDLNQAYRDQIDSARAAVEAQRAIEAAQKSAAESLKRTLDDLTGTRLDLEGQLLTAQGREAEAQALARQRELEKLTGGLGAEDAARVVAAYELNEALRKQIAETNAANQAAQALADAQSRAAEDAARAATQFRDAWKGITDSLFDEVARIRGLFGASGGDSLASLQSRFAITTAQARAGDQEAAKLLPGLSQTLLQLAEEGAASLIDLQRIRAQVAGSLEQTGLGLAGRYGFSVPKLEVGTNYVPKDMLALLHEGEAVVPRAFNPAASGSESGQVVAELRALREENKAQALAIVRLQTELTKVVKRWDGEGLPEERATA